MKHLLQFLLLPLLLAATYRTPNFVVTCDDDATAQAVAEQAERSRADLARAWIGHELDPWPRPCPVKVRVTRSLGGGATSFGFGQGGVSGMSMSVEGRADKLLSAVVPHEVTHTILATFFGQPTARWVDEGASVMAEDAEELRRQDQLCRDILNTPGRMIPLKRLFALREYPSDVMALYAEGYCVTAYLVGLKDRTTLVQTIIHAQSRGWDEAIRVNYSPWHPALTSVNALEAAWLAHMKGSRPGQAGQPAIKQNTSPAAVAPAAAPRAGSPVTVSNPDFAAALRAIAEAQAVQARQLADLDRRVKALEGQRAGQVEPWSQAPARTTTPAVTTPAQPIRYAQPSPWSPSCPPGGT